MVTTCVAVAMVTAPTAQPVPLSCCAGPAMATSEQLFRYTDSGVVAVSCCIVLFAALLAFFLELSEFLVVLRTSSLALSIAGVVKVRGYSVPQLCMFRVDVPVWRQ